ncbi:magnesium transporter [Halalkalibacter hemicellulosilyticus]|uniref:Magnesium transporter MgtE n=1 Tax=Halalkalibacter hemicellulosilyticusJCM 9152 TaxID=1236971 RepID=W4QL14_9BACI|nr:magnesium transporter [Halalkalibacter hemicellulosilyticus]GAE32592.1 magnesium transporter [Halalkalibacter hemicellulosilyticusJCM 9152]
MKKDMMKNREEYTYYLFLSLKNKQKEAFREEFLDLHPTDQTEIFKQMSHEKRKAVYDYLRAKEFAELFQGLALHEQKQVFTELEDQYALEMLKQLPADDITDFFSEIPDHISTYLLSSMNVEEAENIKFLLSHQDDSAGSLMTTEFISVSPTATIDEVMEQLRQEGMGAETIYYIYVVDQSNKLIGVVSLREIISAPLQLTIDQVMKEQVVTVFPTMDQERVSKVIKDYNLLAVPVVSEDEQLVGIITVDDVLDVLDDEVSEDIGEFAAARGAVDLDVSSMVATKKRLPWLVLLLLIGMLTAGLIGTFEATLAEVALLAMFIPLIADMAGNTGTQSLAVVVRGLALNQFNRDTIIRLIKRETATGLMMGIVCGIIVSMIALFLSQGSPILGFIIGVSLFVTILFSTLSGTIIPLLIHKLKIDPVVASGPFITTINDIIGLFVYFSIATSLLHYF